MTDFQIRDFKSTNPNIPFMNIYIYIYIYDTNKLKNYLFSNFLAFSNINKEFSYLSAKSFVV